MTMKYMEVTPIRLRKQILNKAEREKANKKKKSAALNNEERRNKMVYFILGILILLYLL